MGVPAFFRWLIATWPNTVQPLVDDFLVTRELDWTEPNPIGTEIDCLYLDMNGIIHPCFHPERNPPKSEQDIFHRIETYVEHVLWLARPRKLLYMAMDGVAPRAKLNQQRARRFQAAKEHDDIYDLIDLMRETFGFTPPNPPSKEEFEKLRDSNVITPGTAFMSRLSDHLLKYVASKVQTSWPHLQVIFSDSSVPGEGEHKLVEFIRQQRAHKAYDGTTSHCIYGADADLLFLALCTHEPNFYVLREDVRDWVQETPEAQKFCLVSIEGIRDALWRHASTALGPSFVDILDLERLVDDFVFLCFLCGNDFLPTLPSLSIRDGDVSRIILQRYYEVLADCGYITDRGYIQLDLLAQVVQEIALQEGQRLKLKEMDAASMAQRRKQKILQALSPIVPRGKRQGASGLVEPTEAEEAVLLSRAQELVAHAFRDDVVEDGQLIGYGTHGWCERYYQHKFHFPLDRQMNHHRFCVAREYVEGLRWIMQYYYDGCPSWGWYYSYAHAPLSIDLYTFLQSPNCGQMLRPLVQGSPFPPFYQLLAVLPPQSSHALPQALQPLMTHPNSPLAPYFPKRWKIDFTHKFWKWQGHVLLPIIDERKLVWAASRLLQTSCLTDEERRRNRNNNYPFLALHVESAVGRHIVRKQQKFQRFVDLSSVSYPWGAVSSYFPQPLRIMDRRMFLFALNPLLVQLSLYVNSSILSNYIQHLARAVYCYTVEVAGKTVTLRKTSFFPDFHWSRDRTHKIEQIHKMFEKGVQDPAANEGGKAMPGETRNTPKEVSAAEKTAGATADTGGNALVAVKSLETTHRLNSGETDGSPGQLRYAGTVKTNGDITRHLRDLQLDESSDGDLLERHDFSEGSLDPLAEDLQEYPSEITSSVGDGPETEDLHLPEGEETTLEVPTDKTGRNFLIVDEEEDEECSSEVASPRPADEKEASASSVTAVQSGAPASSPVVDEGKKQATASEDHRKGMHKVTIQPKGWGSSPGDLTRVDERYCIFIAGSISPEKVETLGVALLTPYLPPSKVQHTSELRYDALWANQHVVADPRPRVVDVPIVKPDRRAFRYLTLAQLRRQREQRPRPPPSQQPRPWWIPQPIRSTPSESNSSPKHIPQHPPKSHDQHQHCDADSPLHHGLEMAPSTSQNLGKGVQGDRHQKEAAARHLPAYARPPSKSQTFMKQPPPKHGMYRREQHPTPQRTGPSEDNIMRPTSLSLQLGSVSDTQQPYFQRNWTTTASSTPHQLSKGPSASRCGPADWRAPGAPSVASGNWRSPPPPASPPKPLNKDAKPFIPMSQRTAVGAPPPQPTTNLGQALFLSGPLLYPVNIDLSTWTAGAQ